MWALTSTTRHPKGRVVWHANEDTWRCFVRPVTDEVCVTDQRTILQVLIITVIICVLHKLVLKTRCCFFLISRDQNNQQQKRIFFQVPRQKLTHKTRFLKYKSNQWGLWKQHPWCSVSVLIFFYLLCENCFEKANSVNRILFFPLCQADAVVNSTDPALKHTYGQVAKEMLKRASSQLTDQCQKLYPTGIGNNMVAITDAFGLNQFKKIFHVAMPPAAWDPKVSLSYFVEYMILMCLWLSCFLLRIKVYARNTSPLRPAIFPAKNTPNSIIILIIIWRWRN